MEQRSQKLDSFKKIVKKAVNAKVKAVFRSRFYACKTNQHYFQDTWPAAIKANIQG